MCDITNNAIVETECCCGKSVIVDIHEDVEEDDVGSVVKPSLQFVAIACMQAQQYYTI